MCDGIAKLIPAPPGKTVTLAMPEKKTTGVIYARKEPRAGSAKEAEEEVAELLALAKSSKA
jgi:DNA polymerase-3 subunit alpha